MPFAQTGLLASTGANIANMGMGSIGNVADLGAGFAMNGADQLAMNAGMFGTDALTGIAGVGADATSGFWSGLGDIGTKAGDMLGSKGFSNLTDLGIKGYGAYNQAKAQKSASSMANKSFAMQQDAYNRNVEADEKRKALRFG